MAEYYDPKRVDILRQIMPVFLSHARKNDEILFGLTGDPYYPQEFDHHRPTGKIIRIKNEGTENATIRVRVDNGAVCDLAAGNIAPDRLWEYTPASWNNVLSRLSEETEKEAKPPPIPTLPPSSDGSFEDIRQRLDQLATRVEKELAKNGEFNSAMVHSFGQLASEVARTSDRADFAKDFKKQYTGMIKANPATKPKRQARAFDSDFDGSSEDEM